MNLEQTLEDESGACRRIGWAGIREYGGIVVGTEVGSWIGTAVGVAIYCASDGSSSSEYDSALFTSCILAGDYLGGTYGELRTYIYQHWDKYSGLQRFFGLAKDCLKSIIYDIPVVALTYSLTAPILYFGSTYGFSKEVLVGIHAMALIPAYHGINYFKYMTVRNDVDENVLYHAVELVRD
jgi:hypothetical protein